MINMLDVFNCHLMVFNTSEYCKPFFLTLLFSCSCFLIATEPYYGVVLCLFQRNNISNISFSFNWQNLISSINFFWTKNGPRVLDGINDCCYWCLILLFIFTCFLDNGWSYHSNAVVFSPLGYLRWKRYFCSIFGRKYLSFLGVFRSVPHLVDIYAKNADDRGRNFMCKRTLPSFFDPFPNCKRHNYFKYNKKKLRQLF